MFGSKGKINITIQKTNYAPGDTISGNVALTLKKPVQAREVSISLIGEEISTGGGGTVGWGGGRTSGKTWGGGTMGGSGASPTIQRIYDFKQQLDGEKEYSEGREYQLRDEDTSRYSGHGTTSTGREARPSAEGRTNSSDDYRRDCASTTPVVSVGQTRHSRRTGH